MPDTQDFERNNRRFHEIVMNEDWAINKLDVAERPIIRLSERKFR